MTSRLDRLLTPPPPGFSCVGTPPWLALERSGDGIVSVEELQRGAALVAAASKATDSNIPLAAFPVHVQKTLALFDAGVWPGAAARVGR